MFIVPDRVPTVVHRPGTTLHNIPEVSVTTRRITLNRFMGRRDRVQAIRADIQLATRVDGLETRRIKLQSPGSELDVGCRDDDPQVGVGLEQRPQGLGVKMVRYDCGWTSPPRCC